MSGQVSPSLLYATAAVLEGCSFVNGGSQNTVQAGLVELGEQSAAPCYVLGTDFKAGQTKAKTAIVESAARHPYTPPPPPPPLPPFTTTTSPPLTHPLRWY